MVAWGEKEAEAAEGRLLEGGREWQRPEESRARGSCSVFFFFLSLLTPPFSKKKHPPLAPLSSLRELATMASSLATSVRGVRVAPTQQVRIASWPSPEGQRAGVTVDDSLVVIFFVVLERKGRARAIRKRRQRKNKAPASSFRRFLQPLSSPVSSRSDWRLNRRGIGAGKEERGEGGRAENRVVFLLLPISAFFELACGSTPDALTFFGLLSISFSCSRSRSSNLPRSPREKERARALLQKPKKRAIRAHAPISIKL